MQILVPGALIAGLGVPVRAQGDPPKYEVEARVMFWAVASERDTLPGQQESIGDFLVRRMRVSVQGRPSEAISFSLQAGQDNIGGRIATDDGSIRIKDAYINYRVTDRLQLMAGQFKIPFLRASLESGFNQLLVDRGVLPSLRPAREGSRDLGVMGWGNVNGFQYRVAVFDGSDQERQQSESSVRLSSRVAYNWFTREPGVSYAGTHLGARRVLQVAGQVDLQSSRLDPRDEPGFAALSRDYRAYAVELFFEQPLTRRSAVTFDAAWLDRDDDYLEPATATRHLEGYYLQGGYLLPGQIGPGRVQVAGRWEDWTVERAAAAADSSRASAGLTYYLSGHSRKIQADFTRRREEPETRNDELRVSLVLMF